MKTKIKKLLADFKDFEAVAIKASDELLKAKKDAETRNYKVNRNGKDIVITEKDLWDEVWNGAKTDARVILKEKYPEAFNLSEEADKKGQEIQTFLSVEFDLPTQKENLLSFGKLINFIIILIENYE